MTKFIVKQKIALAVLGIISMSVDIVVNLKGILTLKTTFCVIFLAKKFVLSKIIRIFAASVLAKPLNNAQIVRGVFYLYVSQIFALLLRTCPFSQFLSENSCRYENKIVPLR